jgi:signal transduction histidine kinase
MTGSIFLGLLQNTAILLAFSMLYDNLWIRRERKGNPYIKILIGLLIGAIGIILMLSPWTMVPGVVFDTRTVMLSISGLFFGPIPTITAMVIDTVYRWYVGGHGVWMGIATIIGSGSIGMLWRSFRFHRIQVNKNRELLLMGIAVHVVMIASTLLLPSHLDDSTRATLILPIIIVYIPATVLLGRLMLNQYDHYINRRIKEQLLESERKLNLDLVKAKEQAEESDRLKTAFLANLSHEIRTPLNGILGFADILQNPSITDDEIRDYIGMIRISGTRMLEIMQNLIDISKLESGTMNLHHSEFNLHEQLDNLYYAFYNEANEKGLELKYSKGCTVDNYIIVSDEEKINSILTNLLKNAIKFSSSGTVNYGYIINDEGCLECFVSDEGIGIPFHRQSAVFERFIQADSTPASTHEGAGLGLSIAKAFVEMLGGAIWMNSVPGKGTEVRFTVPATAPKTVNT